MTQELPVIDLALGAKLLDGDEQVAKSMIQELAAILPEGLEDLKSAYEAQDLKRLADIAHYLHGGTCYCGTPRLKAAAIALEKRAKTSESFHEMRTSFESLCAEIDAVVDACENGLDVGERC